MFCNGLTQGPILAIRARKSTAHGTRRSGGIDDRALPHRHPSVIEVSLERLKDLFAQPVLLLQVTEGEDHRLIRNPVGVQVHAGKTAHAGNLDQGLFHGWITEAVPLLLQVDPKHCRQRAGRMLSLPAHLGVYGLD